MLAALKFTNLFSLPARLCHMPLVKHIFISTATEVFRENDVSELLVFIIANTSNVKAIKQSS